MQLVDVPGREYLPAGQVVIPVPSVLGQTLPAGHTVHSVADALLAYVPAGQAAGVLVALSVHTEPTGQGVHVPSPAAAYEPGAQGMGGSEFTGQRCPAGQVLQVVLAPSEYCVGVLHVTMPVPSVLGQADPAGHTVHSVCDDVA